MTGPWVIATLHAALLWLAQSWPCRPTQHLPEWQAKAVPSASPEALCAEPGRLVLRLPAAHGSSWAGARPNHGTPLGGRPGMWVCGGPRRGRPPVPPAARLSSQLPLCGPRGMFRRSEARPLPALPPVLAVWGLPRLHRRPGAPSALPGPCLNRTINNFHRRPRVGRPGGSGPPGACGFLGASRLSVGRTEEHGQRGSRPILAARPFLPRGPPPPRGSPAVSARGLHARGPGACAGLSPAEAGRAGPGARGAGVPSTGCLHPRMGPAASSERRRPVGASATGVTGSLWTLEKWRSLRQQMFAISVDVWWDFSVCP